MSGDSTAPPVPRVAFLGFCDRTVFSGIGNPVLWGHHVIGISSSRCFYVYPANLRGQSLLLGIYKIRDDESFTLRFNGANGEPPFSFVFQISSVQPIAQGSYPAEYSTSEKVHTVAASSGGWTLLPIALNADLIVNSPGNYDVWCDSEAGEQYLGAVWLAHVSVPPFTSEEIAAIRSDPMASKFVRAEYKCTKCHDSLKAYAGVERSAASESLGFRWNQEIAESEFKCSCGAMKFSLAPIRTGLHGLLRRNTMPETAGDFSSVRLYERTALECSCKELCKMLEAEVREEELQDFLELHPIFFHVFLPKKLFFKPPILTQYFADFALLNNRDELVLIEIERANLRLLKKDGDITAELGHAFFQVRTWMQVINDHRSSALDALGLSTKEVAKVRGIVVAGRRPSDEKALRMLRTVSTSEIELFTYDDLQKGVTELLKHIANV